MICKYSSFIFQCILFILSFHNCLSSNFKFVLLASNTIIRCSQHEYLFIRDWYAFKKSNKLCKNQADLFGHNYHVYNMAYGKKCEKKEITLNYFAKILPQENNGEHTFTDSMLNELSSLLRSDTSTEKFKAKQTDKVDHALIAFNSKPFKQNMTLTHYLIFPEQNIACLLEIRFHSQYKKCNDAHAQYYPMCYHDPGKYSPLETLNWNTLKRMNDGEIHLPQHWY